MSASQATHSACHSQVLPRFLLKCVSSLSSCFEWLSGERVMDLGLELKPDIWGQGSAFSMGLLFHLGKSLDFSGLHFFRGNR